MTAMKLENFEGTVDTFTFPNNSFSFDVTSDSNHTVTVVPYSNHHIFISGGGLSPRTLVLIGTLFGTSKRTNYQSLARHFQETTQLKKLFFEADKFYLGIGKQIKQTNTGSKTNNIDYVASFESVIGKMFDDTLNTSGTNDGNVTTFIESITGTVTNGASNLVFSDLHGTTITVNNADLTTAFNFRYDMVRMIDTGNNTFTTIFNYVGIKTDSGTASSTSSFKLVEAGQDFVTTVSVGDLVQNTTDSTFAYVSNIDGNTTLSLTKDIMASGETFIIFAQSAKVTVNPSFGLLKLTSGQNVSAITTTNVTSGVVSFRDAYSA